jgi:hypothetical protein
MKLLSKRAAVTAIVRSADRLPAEARGHELLTVVVVPDGHLALSDAAMAQHMRGQIKPEIATSRTIAEPCSTSRLLTSPGL